MTPSTSSSNRNAIRNYRDLIVWQKGMTLARTVYEASADFPDRERFGLTQQLRRAVVSVPSNIAEGHGRMSNGDYARFLSIARGSLHETETLILLSIELSYLKSSDVDIAMGLIRECSKMLAVLIRKVGRPGPKR